MDDLRARAVRAIEKDPRLCREIFKVLSERTAAGMTERQRELYDFIKAQISCTGLAPNYDEMAFAMNVGSKSTINRLVSGLRDRGLIKSLPGRPRSIQIIGSN